MSAQILSDFIPTTFNDFDLAIEQEVHKKNWFGRVARGFDEFGEDKGRLAEVAVVVCSFVGTLLVGGVVFASTWGGYEMFKENVLLLRDGERPSANLGHAGQWSAQVLIYVYVYFRELHRMAGEGDLHTVRKIFRRMFRDSPIKLENLNETYRYVLQTTKLMAHTSLFHRSHFTNKAKSIELILENTEEKDLEPQLDHENLNAINHLEKMREIFENVQRNLDKVLSVKNYFKRSWEGIKSIYQSRGKTGIMASLVTGVALPLLLGANAVFVMAGTGLMCDDLANHREYISAIGHVGEWPVEALGLAYLSLVLYEWSVTSKGDLVLAREVMQSHFDRLSEEMDEATRDQFVQTANEELLHIASKCMIPSNPSTYLLNEKNGKRIYPFYSDKKASQY